MRRAPALTIASFLISFTAACSNPQPGPDKTFAGGLLGAGWGAGTGAVIGNHVATSGEGAAVGAGFGAVSGALGGAGYDLAEGAIIDQERALAALKIENEATARELSKLQDKLDRAASVDVASGVFQTFFDVDTTTLRSGAIANLEAIAESIKRSPRITTIRVIGHADDSGTPDYNERVAEARARSVAAYLAARGISTDRIQVSSFGSKRPLVTNGTTEGRQLNRRVDIVVGN